jgi:hypothetical protein
MNNTRKRVFGFILGASLLATAGTAMADKKVQNGWVCVEHADATPEITYDNFGAVRNGAAAQFLKCPLLRENELATMDVTDWDITVDRRGAAAAWDLTLWSVNDAGDSGFASTITVPAAPASGAIHLDGGTIVSAFLDGQMYLESTVPAGAEIRRISVNES